MVNHHSEILCTVCSALNLTFKYPPKEVAFQKWLREWEKQRPRYNWRTQDRSWEARWKRMEKRVAARHEARLRRIRDGGRWSDSGSSDSESDTDYSTSTGLDDRDGDQASLDTEDGGNGPSSEGDDDDDTDGSSGDDDGSEDSDGEGQSIHIAEGSDSDSQSYEDAKSHLSGSPDNDGMTERSAGREANVSASSSEIDDCQDGGKDDGEGASGDQENLDNTVHEWTRQKFKRVLEYLGMDPSQYRLENRPNSSYPEPYVLKRKVTENDESEYESDGQSTINDFLLRGPDYALESDEKFERGIRDEMDTWRAELSLERRWKLETHHVRRCHKEARKPVELGTVLDICGRLPCSFCMLLLEMLKPSLQCPAEYNRDEFKVEWIPQDLKKEKVSLEFDTEREGVIGIQQEREDSMEFIMWPIVRSTRIGCIRRADPVDCVDQESRYGAAPWLLDPKLEISAYQPLDTRRFREQVETCQRDHSICRAIQSSTSVDPDYRTLFIDVDQGSLVYGTLGQRYLALSYVWGNVPALQTTQKSLARFMEPAALESNNQALSRVIRDAISLTRMLGERLLWVDALCIVQDDAVHKSRHISNMDLIYKQSALTIIAHSGVSANSPLPGVTGGTRLPIVRSWRIGGLELVAQAASLGSPSLSPPYDTRGWTYQEEALSPRRLYIYHSHASLECCTAKYLDIVDREEEIRRGWHGPASSVVASLQHRHATTESRGPLPFDADNYQFYIGIITAFSARKLTLQSDKLNAFSGMTRVLETIFETPFCDGLPERFLDAGLLWSSHPKGPYKFHEWGYEAHLKIYARNPDFPSWSWSGHDHLLEGYNGFALLFTHSDCNKILSEVAGFAVLSPGSSRPRRITRSASCPLVDLAQGDRDVSQDVPQDVRDRLARVQTVSCRNNSILCFPARVVEGECLLVDGRPSRLCSGSIFTAGTEWFCGMLYPDDSEVWREPPQGRRRWIILSRGCVQGPDGPDFKQMEGIGYSECFDEDKFKIRCKWTFYHVMLVEERGAAGMVERLALGQIHIDAWPVDKENTEMVYLG